MGLTFSEFDPSVIAWQDQVIDDLYRLDYTKGVNEILFSGSIGSSKTTLMAHLVVLHCLENPNARVLICRRALPDLKKTLFAKIVEHLDQPSLANHVTITETTATIKFSNGSIIMPGYWADKRYKKFRSLELSMAVFEELTENGDEEKEAYDEISMRVGRVLSVKNNLIIAATNPDSPSHWVYKHFIATDSPLRRVYYSVTTDNPFLPESYIDKLRNELDPLMAQRMIYGKWVTIRDQVIYYAYSREKHFLNKEYKYDLTLPIDISFDFNCGLNKPMSCLIGQFDPRTNIFHCADESVIQSSRTDVTLEDIAGRGILDKAAKYRIFGDATGAARSTKSIHSDYEIIQKFLSNYRTPNGGRINYQMCVPRSNPPIRERHNTVNANLLNDIGQIRTYLYSNCKVLDQGLQLTALKKGADIVEDDSKEYQHLTTALGYWQVYIKSLKKLDGFKFATER